MSIQPIKLLSWVTIKVSINEKKTNLCFADSNYNAKEYIYIGLSWKFTSTVKKLTRKGHNLTSPILHTRLHLNSGEWLWKGISVEETDFCILRIESWCLCCPRLQMKVRRNVFTNMSGPHLPVAKFPNTNTEVTNTK